MIMMNQTKPKIYAEYDKMIMMNQTKPELYLKFDIMIMMNRTRGKHNYTNTSVRANRDLGKIIFQKINIFSCFLVTMLPPDES